MLRPLAGLALLILTACGSRPADSVEALPELDGQLPAEVKAVLEEPDSFEILALHPYPHWEDGTPGPQDEALDDYKVLGKAALPDRGAQRRVLALFYQGIQDSNGMVAACFNPRHGIRARRGDQEVAVVICYECLSLQVHGPGEGQVTNVLTHDGVERRMTALWSAQGLTLHRDDG